MTEAEKPSETAAPEKRTFERRRAPLPQPDFTPYKAAKAYPGPGYFFVGHSYNVGPTEADETLMNKRASAIGACFSDTAQWVAVQKVMDDKNFCEVLTRFEQDMLHRLPANALIGPAIDPHGQLISHSFTIWREERRRQRGDNTSAAPAKAST